MEIHRDMCLCIVYERNNSEVLLNMKVLLNISICYSILVFQKNDSQKKTTSKTRVYKELIIVSALGPIKRACVNVRAAKSTF